MDEQMNERREEADRNELLFWACARGLIADASELVHRGADCNIKDKHGYRPVHFAASHGHTIVLELLGTHGVDLDEEDPHGSTPLHHAAAGGHAEAVEYLLTHGAWKDMFDANDDTALHLAARRGDTACINALLSAGAKTQLPNKSDLTALGEAVVAGHEVAARLLLDKGADARVSCKGFSLLHLAAGGGSSACLELLLTRGGLKPDEMRSSSERLTALHAAAVGGDLRCVEVLMKHGASPVATTAAGLLPADLVLNATSPEGRKLWELLSKAAKASGGTPRPEPGSGVKALKPLKTSEADAKDKEIEIMSGGNTTAALTAAFARLSVSEQRRKVETYARSSDPELAALGWTEGPRMALAEVRRANQAMMVLGVVVTLQGDAEFQEDVHDTRVRGIIDALKGGADFERYSGDSRVTSVLAKLKRLHAVTRSAASTVKVTMEDVMVDDVESAQREGERRLDVMRKALERTINHAVDVLSGKPPPTPPSARESESGPGSRTLAHSSSSKEITPATPVGDVRNGSGEFKPEYAPGWRGWAQKLAVELGYQVMRSLLLTAVMMAVLWLLGMMPWQQEAARQARAVQQGPFSSSLSGVLDAADPANLFEALGNE